MLLADLGAEVIKVEQPGAGDETRAWGPPFADDGSALYYHAVNRNKSSITLDLKSEVGRKSLVQLIKSSDVLLENFRHSSRQSLGLDQASVLKLNPDIVLASISAYGSSKAWRDKPGYDFLVQALSGLMSITGPTQVGDEREPYKVGVALVDILSGLFAALGILAELLGKTKGQRTSLVELSLFDVMMSSLANVGHAVLNTGKDAKAYGNAHSQIVPYQAFSTQDAVICLAIGNDHQFARLCTVLCDESLRIDEHFLTNARRLLHRQELTERLERIFSREKSEHWLALLEAEQIPAARVQTVKEALVSQLAIDNQLIIEDDDGMRYVRNPLRLNSDILPLRRPSPSLGADAVAVLQSLQPSTEIGEF